MIIFQNRWIMKQYLNSEQTYKLIELGFDKPKNERWVLDVANESTPSIQNIVKRLDYSIGELIEMFDKYQDKLSIVKIGYSWFVNYHTKNIELIDALYDIIVKLKEEGEI